MMRIGTVVCLVISSLLFWLRENLAGVLFMAMAMDSSLAVFFVEWAKPAERKLEELSNEVAQLKAVLQGLMTP